MAPDSDGKEMPTDDAYETVLEKSRRVLNIEKTDFMMWWDSDVMMPQGGAPAWAS